LIFHIAHGEDGEPGETSYSRRGNILILHRALEEDGELRTSSTFWLKYEEICECQTDIWKKNEEAHGRDPIGV
jgi:hypothetical protein